MFSFWAMIGALAGLVIGVVDFVIIDKLVLSGRAKPDANPEQSGELARVRKIVILSSLIVTPTIGLVVGEFVLKDMFG